MGFGGASNVGARLRASATLTRRSSRSSRTATTSLRRVDHGAGTPEPGAEGPTGLLHCSINQLASIPTIVKREALKGDVTSSACGDRGRVSRKSPWPIKQDTLTRTCVAETLRTGKRVRMADVGAILRETLRRKAPILAWPPALASWP